MYAQELSGAVRFETPVPHASKGRKWLKYQAPKESELDRIQRLAVALTDMDFLKLVGRMICDPRISTARLASSLSKGTYPYHAADIASEEIQAKLAAVDWPGGKPLVHPVSSPLTGERNILISPLTAAEKAMRTQRVGSTERPLAAAWPLPLAIAHRHCGGDLSTHNSSAQLRAILKNGKRKQKSSGCS